jgi:hypothetical protein
MKRLTVRRIQKADRSRKVYHHDSSDCSKLPVVQSRVRGVIHGSSDHDHQADRDRADRDRGNSERERVRGSSHRDRSRSKLPGVRHQDRDRDRGARDSRDRDRDRGDRGLAGAVVTEMQLRLELNVLGRTAVTVTVTVTVTVSKIGTKISWFIEICWRGAGAFWAVTCHELPRFRRRTEFSPRSVVHQWRRRLPNVFRSVI